MCGVHVCYCISALVLPFHLHVDYSLCLEHLAFVDSILLKILLHIKVPSCHSIPIWH